jgi:arylsulfatase A-like enzyme/Tfp pilus assembly protein PilF
LEYDDRGVEEKGNEQGFMRAFAFGAMLLGAGHLLSCRQASPLRFAPRPSPNVLLVSIDTLRADHLGCYGAKTGTPTLDTLAASGVLFERAVSHVPLTLPSHASLFTGVYPMAHGIRDNGAFRLSASHRTLAALFREQGYRTGAFVASFPLDSRFGLDQGFQVYDDVNGEGSFYDVKIAERPADEVLNPAAEWIEGTGGERFFAFVHLYDPHSPYEPPAAFAARFASDLYTGEVAYVDDALGRFLARLTAAGRMDNTLVLVTADHGEGLGEHGEKTHGMFAYDSTLRVPLIFHWKDALPEGLRVPARVRLVDVAPTLLSLAGLPSFSEFQGETLVDVIAGREKAADRDSYFEALSFNLSRNWAPLTGLYRGSSKFIDLPIPELYDLEADPLERENLAPSRPDDESRLRSALEELVAASASGRDPESAKRALDAETVAQLRTLGYVVGEGSGDPAPKECTEADDPKRLAPLADKLDAGTNARIAGRPEEAIRLYREILQERPTFTRASILLAHVLEGTGRVDEAIGVLQKALAAGQEEAQIFGMLGWCLEKAGRAREATAMLRVALDKDPGNVEAWNSLALAHAQLGERDQALDALDELLALDPSYPSAHVNRGAVFLEEKNYEEAEKSFRRALERDETMTAAWNGLGIAAAGAGRDDEAVAAWKRAVELSPDEYDALLNLTLLLRRLHRQTEEAAYLTRFVKAAPAGYEADLRRARARLAELGRSDF